MYPSSSSSFFNGNDLISYPNQPFCSRTLSTESNPSSKDQETNCALPPPPAPSSLSFFPFPYFPFDDNEIFPHQHHDDDLLDLQHHHHHHQSLAPPPHEAAAGVVNTEVSITTTTKVIPPNKSTTPPTTSHHNQQQIPMRRRSSKRDRHSKINTAKGLRDRRMRLALDVAKRFFGLQDMLGFDKASKTVEWLLNQAKVEIKQLAREKNIHPSCSTVGAKSASSTSECEGVSSLDEVAVSGNQGQEGDEKAVPIPTTTIVKRRTNNRPSRKSAFNPISKESREKARERARERTWEKEKLKTRRLGVVDEESKANKQCNNNEAIITIHSLSRSDPWNPFETVEESQIRVNPSLDVLACDAEERSSQAKDQHLGCVDQDLAHDDSFVIMSRWSPAMILNSLNNPGILQEHQFAEFQSMGKPWEAYNNHI